jgi:tetratricopeptide (TPR) repeat protein
VGCLAYAEVAEAAAAELPPGHEALHARALAELGNALRINNRLKDAAKKLNRACRDLPEEAPDAYAAEVWSLQASMLAIASDYTGAADQAAAALAAYLRTGQRREAARVRVKLGMILAHCSRYDEAQAVLMEAMAELESDLKDPLLHINLVNIALVWVLWVETCRDRAEKTALIEYALDCLDGLRALASSLPKLERYQFEFLRGMVMLNDGKLGSAERTFREVVDGMTAIGEPVHASFAAVYLLLALLKLDELDEARQLAADLIRQFEEADLREDVAWVLKKVAAATSERVAIRALSRIVARGAPGEGGAPRGILP